MLKNTSKLGIASYEVTAQDIYALRALINGEATESQQKQALNWIQKEACGYYNMSFHPKNERLTDFNEGRRFVANIIFQTIAEDPKIIEKKDLESKIEREKLIKLKNKD